MPRIKVTAATLYAQFRYLYPQLKKELETTPALEITIRKVTRNLQQNARLHAMLGDISKQCDMQVLNSQTGEFEPQRVDIEVWKRATLSAWFRAENQSPAMLIKALDDTGLDIVHHKSSKLTVEQAASYIEYLNFVGAERGVKWSAPAHMQDGDR